MYHQTNYINSLYKINKNLKKLCIQNNLKSLKIFYENKYINDFYSINNNKINIRDIKILFLNIFNDCLHQKKVSKEILLWFISLDIIDNISYNNIFNKLCLKNNIDKAKFLYELNLIDIKYNDYIFIKSAIFSDNLKIIIWLHSIKAYPTNIIKYNDIIFFAKIFAKKDISDFLLKNIPKN